MPRRTPPQWGYGERGAGECEGGSVAGPRFINNSKNNNDNNNNIIIIISIIIIIIIIMNVDTDHDDNNGNDYNDNGDNDNDDDDNTHNNNHNKQQLPILNNDYDYIIRTLIITESNVIIFPAHCIICITRLN